MLIGETDWRVVNLDKLTYAGNLENLAAVDGNQRYRVCARRYLRRAGRGVASDDEKPTPSRTSRLNRMSTAAFSRRSR